MGPSRSFPRVGHVSPAQNKRLRRAMLAYRKKFCGDETTELAHRLERAQPSISNFLNKKSGASFLTAHRFAKLVKTDVNVILGPPDEEDGENLETESSYPDMPVGTFLLELRDREGLYDAVKSEPGRWRLSTVVRAIGGTFQDNTEAAPKGGWPALLDAIQSGVAEIRPEGSVRSDTNRQVGSRPKLPQRLAPGNGSRK